MKTTAFVRAFWLAGFFALALSARAQIVELRATINAAQETPTSTSGASGSAVMFYNVATNTFDLVVTVNNMGNTATLSHVHEAVPGVAGPVVTNLGGESAYKRSGNTLTATFHDLTYGGTPLTLIQGGAYYNIHSAQFPGGEVRGQLVPQPVKLVANFTVDQERAAFPTNTALAQANLADFGAAVMLYDPVANRVSLRLSLFNFANPLNNSHYHEGAVAVSGPVVVNLGNNANAGGYTTANGHIAGTFDIPYTGTTAPDPIKLLTGGAYLNFHSTTFPQGELRGQVRVTNELPNSRFANMSVRGFVGEGQQALIEGITVSGPDPMRVLITAKGPSLAAAGVTGALANPRLALFDFSGRQIASNDDVGAIVAGSDLATIYGVPTNPVESALTVVLPPGNYTAIVFGNGGTGIALLEVSDLRNTGIRAVASESYEQKLAMIRERATAPRARTSAPLELCTVPLPLAAAVTR